MGLKIVVLGGGGCAGEVLDVVDALVADGASIEVLGVLDDGHPDAGRLAGWAVERLGGIDHLAALPKEVAVVAGIGSPSARRAVLALAAGRTSPTLVHPDA